MLQEDILSESEWKERWMIDTFFLLYITYLYKYKYFLTT